MGRQFKSRLIDGRISPAHTTPSALRFANLERFLDSSSQTACKSFKIKYLDQMALHDSFASSGPNRASFLELTATWLRH